MNGTVHLVILIGFDKVKLATIVILKLTTEVITGNTEQSKFNTINSGACAYNFRKNLLEINLVY